MAEIVNWFNIVIGVLGFIWLLFRTTSRWSEYPREIQLLLVTTLGFIFALLETSAEQLFLDLGGSVNPYIIMAVKMYLLFVLFDTRTTKYRTGTRQDDGNPDENANHNVL